MTRDEFDDKLDAFMINASIGLEDKVIDIGKELLAEHDRLTALNTRLVEVCRSVMHLKGEFPSGYYDYLIEKAEAAINAVESEEK